MKVPRAASCASVSLQRGKDFPVASKDRSEKGAVPGKEDAKDRGEGLECTQAHKKEEEKRVQSSTPCGDKNNGVWEGRSTLLHRTLGKTT